MKREDITKAFPDATKEQIDALMAINGADITKAKGEADKLKADLADAQKKLTEKADPPEPDKALAAQLAELKKEIRGMKAAETVRATREKVAKETGIPANLLTGETEEDCTAQAQSLKDYIKTQSPSYPTLTDSGEVTGAKTAGADSAWTEFAAALSNT